MSSGLNQLFQVNPQAFLETTVLFADELAVPISHLLSHPVDLEPVSPGRAKAKLLAAVHAYQGDQRMLSYLVPVTGSVMVPKENGPHTFVFLPEFNACRLLVRQDGESWLRLSLDRPGDKEPLDPKYCDGFSYWETTTGDLVGTVRATVVVVKEPAKPWRLIMQQIVGPPGGEVVRQVLTRDLVY